VNKRHARPTSRQLLDRVYRRQIASDKRLDAIESLIHQDANGRAVLLKTVTDHCWRLLREKETLMRLIDHDALRAVHEFMSRPLQ
jgi:hypothetical protein